MILGLLTAATCAVLALLLVQFYRQSTTEQVQRAEAVAANACDQVHGKFEFLVRGWNPSGQPLENPEFRDGLRAAVIMALASQPGVSGGIWQEQTGSLTPLPDSAPSQVELQAVNQRAAQQDQPELSTVQAGQQTVVLAACPLGGPVTGLTAWTMVRTEAAPSFNRLRTGLLILLALLIGMSAWLAWLVITWTAHVARMERVLASPGDGALPPLALTGEKELDRIVAALNEAGRRLAQARRRSEELAAQVAASERLAALGRVAAGVAHEIRNPIAAMRLRAENAMAADPARARPALAAILTQISRLDSLVSQLLEMTQRRPAKPRPVVLQTFLEQLAGDYREAAGPTRIIVEPTALTATLDPDLTARTLGNLVLNAIQHTPGGGEIRVAAAREAGWVRITVADNGPGVPPELRQTLFDPFVTSRPEGTGLGLAIAREFAEAQGGRLELVCPGGCPPHSGATFALFLPCRPS